MMLLKEQLEKLTQKGILQPGLRLGIVTSVAAHHVKINLIEANSSTGSYFAGGRYGKGEVGEFILIEAQQSLLLGRIIEVKLPEHERHNINQIISSSDKLDAIAHVQLLGTVTMDRLFVSAGVDSYPRLGDKVYSAPHQFISLIPSLMNRSISEEVVPVQISLGSVNVAHESKINITPEKLFGRHCAILGATGGGKSWTTARIIEECLKHSAKVILIDATGEYRGINNEHVVHCHLGDPVEIAENSIKCLLPPTNFQESDFIALFEPSGKVQGPKLKAAIRSLRLAKLRTEIAKNGLIEKINQRKENIVKAEQNAEISKKLEDPRQEFDCALLTKQIEQECVWPDGGTANQRDTSKWGGANDSEYSYCLSLASRINGVLTSSAFECVFGKDKDSTLTEQIDKFIAEDKRLLRICLSGVGYEFKAREIVTNAIGRKLLNSARERKFKSQPVIVFIDEAHNFLGRHIGTEDTVAKLDAFELIAREGRKYGLNICLATQRPRDLTEGVLSQIGTLIIHRLTNDKDREIVERACSEVDHSTSKFLPNLQPGEVAIIGTDFPIPLTVQIQPPTYQPESDSPKFQQHWAINYEEGDK